MDMNLTELKKEEKNLSWIDLKEEEIIEISDVQTCMYGMQQEPKPRY